jgi:hypothetical protein
MKLSSRVFGVIVAAGSLAAMEVRAQEADAGSSESGAKAPAKSSKAQKRSQKSQPQPTPYGDVVNGPATTDAEGIPVAKPNPLSEEKKEGDLGGIGNTPGELTNESNSSDAAKSPDQGK